MNEANINIDYDKIEDMVEGDDEFRIQLLEAILVAVKELQGSYIKGIDTKSDEIIKQARHKIKPTLTLFGLVALSSTLGEGKLMIQKGGLEQDLEAHKLKFISVSDAILADIKQKLNN
jgi:hypothetical protein